MAGYRNMIPRLCILITIGNLVTCAALIHKNETLTIRVRHLETPTTEETMKEETKVLENRVVTALEDYIYALRGEYATIAVLDNLATAELRAKSIAMNNLMQILRKDWRQ